MIPLSVESCQWCGANVISNYHWRRLPESQLDILRAARIRPKHGARQCHSCRESRLKRAEALLVPVTNRYTRAELLAEWERFADRSLSLRRNCYIIGPRIGMRPHAMEKALNRAGVRAWPTAKRAA